MVLEAMRREMEALGPWHHGVEVAPGLNTSTYRSSAEKHKVFVEHYSPDLMMRQVLGDLFPKGLEGRSFLDCACNSGGHSVTAAKMGSGRTFGFDARQLWVDQGNFLARAMQLPNVTFDCFELKDLPSAQKEPFDITLFSGIFYHLPDPVAGLRVAADLTKELLILNTSVLPRRGKALTLNFESDRHVLSGVDTLAWLPSGPAVLQDILAWCGFPHTRIDSYWSQGGTAGWKRIQILAARHPEVFDQYDRKKPWAKKPPNLIHRVGNRIHRALNRS